MKVHVHSEQFDGAWHAACGRGSDAVPPLVFEATPRERRCAFCDRDWFPHGQPEWHLSHAQRMLAAHLTTETTLDARCPTCGEDGGTSCGIPNCGLLS